MLCSPLKTAETEKLREYQWIEDRAGFPEHILEPIRVTTTVDLDRCARRPDEQRCSLIGSGASDFAEHRFDRVRQFDFAAAKEMVRARDNPQLRAVP
jgi:hypothetical protein